jgi:hypothetical protein
MPAPLVVVEVPVADRAEPLAETLLKACSEGVAEGRCILGTEREEPDVVAVAIVTWEDERRVVTVAVGRRRSERAEWLKRRLEFKSADALKERWRAAGLVIATLVGEAQRQEREAAAGAEASPSSSAPEKKKEEAPPAPPRAPAPASTPREAGATPTQAPRREIAWLDAGASVDPGVGDGWFRWGGWIRAAVRPSSLPLFVAAGGRYSGMPSDDRGLALRWASASLGVGTFVDLSPLRLEVRADGLVQLVHARAVDATGASDASQRWTFGARLGGDVVWAFAPMWALVGGAEAAFLSSGTAVHVGGETRGRDAAFDLGALAGARAIFR